MFCTKCGNKNAEGAAFCHKCGAKAVGAVVSPPTAMPKMVMQNHVPQTIGTPLFAVGSTVLAKWSDGNYYPGSISEIRDGQALVHFDDGDVSWVKLTEIAESEEDFTDNTFNNEATVTIGSVIRDIWGIWIRTKYGGAITILAVLALLGTFVVPSITRGPAAGDHDEYIAFTVTQLHELLRDERDIYMRYVHDRPIALTGEISEITNWQFSLRVPGSSWASAVSTNNSIRRSINDNYFAGDSITLYGIADYHAFNIPVVNRATNIRPPNARIVTLDEVRRR